MERIASWSMTLSRLRKLFGPNFIGPEEVRKLLSAMHYPFSEIPIPPMQYSNDYLKTKAKEYLLVMGFSGIRQRPLNILCFRNVFGIDPIQGEPCFYNQDWYINEQFVNNTLDNRWYLLKKEVFNESRAVDPNLFQMNENISFPSAILCVYSFFAYFISTGERLWEHDFVWCKDVDHNGDRIYVGKYHDVDGINKNGFSIHRHLALRPCYAAINAE